MTDAPEQAGLIEEGGALLRRIQEEPASDHGDEIHPLQAFIGHAERTPLDEAPLELTQLVAFARLMEINLLIVAERVEDASGAAARLLAMFSELPDGPQLAGFGTMLLDATFWLQSRERDADALAISDALVARLGDGGASERTVAAGGRFFAAQAAGRLGRMVQSRTSLEALCEMGEPALAALDRIAAQFGPTDANPTWHAQVAATSVTVLWRLGRPDEARALAREAAERFESLGLPDLARMLSELKREVAG